MAKDTETTRQRQDHKAAKQSTHTKAPPKSDTHTQLGKKEVWTIISNNELGHAFNTQWNADRKNEDEQIELALK